MNFVLGYLLLSLFISDLSVELKFMMRELFDCIYCFFVVDDIVMWQGMYFSGFMLEMMSFWVLRFMRVWYIYVMLLVIY